MGNNLQLIFLSLVFCASCASGEMHAVFAAPDAAATSEDASAQTVIDPAPATAVSNSDIEGLIYLTEMVSAETQVQQAAVQAFFTPAPMPFFTPLQDLGGGCQLYPLDEVGATQFSAGKVIISGGPQIIELEPQYPFDPEKWLYPGIFFGELFDAKTILSVQAQGNQVSSFSGSGAGAGEANVFFSDDETISRGQDLTLQFAPTTEKIMVVLLAAQDKHTVSQIRCQGLLDEHQQFVIPQAALAALAPEATSVMIAAGTYNETLITPNERTRIHLLATHLMTTSYSLLEAN